MFPNGFGMNGYWGPENYVLGAALFDWHKDFDDLPEEVKEYLTQHEYEIHSENDVDRLVRTYNQKREKEKRKRAPGQARYTFSLFLYTVFDFRG